MSELTLFIAGTGVFAITTTSTLLYGYLKFAQRAAAEGVATVDGIEPEVASTA